MSKPKIIIFDTETAPAICAVFTLYPESINHTNIIRDWFMICACWKELGSKKINSVAITKEADDYKVVKTLRDALADADIIIGQNISKFDIKKLNARLMFHRLKPLPLIPVIDTLKEVKKVSSHTSHRLDYLCKSLNGVGKLNTSPGLWLKAMKGDKQSLKEMVRYCGIDVVRTEELYQIIKPYMQSSVHVGAISGVPGVSCRTCGSTHLKKNGTRFTATGLKRQELQCLTCHGYMKVTIK